MKTKLTFLISIFSLLLAGCGGLSFAAPTPTETVTASPTPTTTATATPSLTPTVTPTFTASPSPTPTWVQQGPDQVKVPILMYHHVELSPIQSNYRVSAARFDEQMHLLHDWGYQTISTSMLVSAIQGGTQLPPRPVIITFDDDDLDVYTVAFPIMQTYGFTGVAYVPYEYIGGDGYMSKDQLLALYNAGWEVGSHSMTHRDLNSLDPDAQRFEIVESRQKLEALLGIPVLTFAYPFGVNSSGVVDYVRFAGYIAGMGATGFTADQGISNLYVLQRCEIKETDVVTDERYFARFLPWWGDPPTFPTNTPAPTNTPRPTETPAH